jgi:hypothetical protein
MFEQFVFLNPKPKRAGRHPAVVTILSLLLKGLFCFGLFQKIDSRIPRGEYRYWVATNFGSQKILNSREKVWEKLFSSISSDVNDFEFVGIEFGVAWGYLTWWFLKRAQSNMRLWIGFDRFTGLPRGWRNYKKGSFDAGGNVPNLVDDRLVWQVGDIEDTINNLINFSQYLDQRIVVFFDLDIFEPSLIAWQHVKTFLKPGDVLYFDEAHDNDERTLLDKYVLPFAEFEPIAVSFNSLALKLLKIS